MNIVVVDCKQLIGKRYGVEINFMVLDYKPAVPVLCQLFISVDSDKNLPEFLTDLHNKGNASIEGIFFDLVNN
jgi:hypothetical protein